MKEYHDVPLIEHVSVHQTVDHIKRAFWWKGLWGDVGQYVRSCLICQLMKADTGKRRVYCSQFPCQNGNGSKLQLTWSQIC